MQTNCTPLVNLARKPAPMVSPSQNQSQVRFVCRMRQKTITASAHSGTLNESIVIRMEPTAKSGMMMATARHHNATRSS